MVIFIYFSRLANQKCGYRDVVEQWDIHPNNIEEQVVIFHDQKEKGNKIQGWGKLYLWAMDKFGEKMVWEFH
jgi:hypothetical protein